MTSDEILACAMELSACYELVAGEVVAMAPERSAHAQSAVVWPMAWKRPDPMPTA
jgi:hypothetical protein